MSDIKEAGKLISQGGLVIFPTETVYGIGADATNQEACLEIFKAKGRPINNPLIIHLVSLEEIENIAYLNEDAKKMAKLWPGPMTMVLPLREGHNIAKSVTSGLNTIAVRIPSHPIALELIRESNCPIAAPSANISGKLTSTIFDQVKEYFKGETYILEGETECDVGIESTILDLTSANPTILRHGFFTKEFLSEYLGKEILVSTKSSKIKAPGMMHKHYAPKTKLRLNAESLKPLEVGLNFGDSALDSENSINLSTEGDLLEAASNLYKYLYLLDKVSQRNNYNSIAVAPIPDNNIGFAINDRLKRASE